MSTAPLAGGRGSGEAVLAFDRRRDPVRRLAGQAGAVAEACHAMAVRFHQGGRLIVFGTGGASTDAQHVAVEFVHPVIDGMDAIFAHQIRYLAAAQDIALGISPDGNCMSVTTGLATAKALGMLTIGLAGGDGGAMAASPAVDHVLIAASDDPRIVKELQVTTYHVLWELVHVFFEQPGVLTPGVLA
jgi:D-sedoheptulose 7-phosphate isomerase